jgi:hypothetical protein
VCKIQVVAVVPGYAGGDLDQVPLDCERFPGPGRAVGFHRELHPGRGGQRDLPVNPRSPAASVALRDLPHTDQRVRPAPQHHLLQGPELGQVLLLRRLEDSAP